MNGIYQQQQKQHVLEDEKAGSIKKELLERNVQLEKSKRVIVRRNRNV